MSGGARGLRLLSHAVVLVWLATYLAWSRLDSLRVAAPDPERQVRVEARPEAPPAPPAPSPPPRAVAPAPTRRPEPPSEAMPTAPTPVGPAELAEGARLLEGGAAFPALSAGYAAFRSFRSYARAMTGLGARFVVLDRREIVAGVDLDRQALGEVGSLASFSPRARSYTGEAELARLTRRARERFGSDANVAMLVPRGLDAGLFGGIARELAARGEAPESLREIRGHYEPGADGGARLRVESAVRKDGGVVPLNVLFDLSQIAAARAARPAA